MEKISCRIIMPKEVFIDDEFDMVVAPGFEGDFGVSLGHAPLISMIRPGLIELYNNDSVSRTLITRAGFCEVLPSRIIILVDDVQDLGKLDLDLVAFENARSESLQELDVADVEASDYYEKVNEFLYNEAVVCALDK